MNPLIDVFAPKIDQNQPYPDNLSFSRDRNGQYDNRYEAVCLFELKKTTNAVIIMLKMHVCTINTTWLEDCMVFYEVGI